MNTYTVCMAFAMAMAVMAEPPSGYSYSRPGGSGGWTGGGGGFTSSGLSGGGGYTAVSSGYQTNEGASVDSALLEQVRQILLKEEQNNVNVGGHSHGHGGGGVSSQYGVPSSSYGVPQYATRVVGIDLEGIKQAIQVAQFHQSSSIGFQGYPSGPSKPSGSYGAPY